MKGNGRCFLSPSKRKHAIQLRDPKTQEIPMKLRKICQFWWYVSLMLLLLLSCSVVSNSVRPQRRQPTRLPRPWDSPGKNTGVGCHFLLQCIQVKSERGVAQSCLTLSDPMDCSPLDFSIHGIFYARVLEWGAIAFSDVSLICPCKCYTESYCFM